jgi:hypothetical protein
MRVLFKKAIFLLIILLISCEFRQVQSETRENELPVADTNVIADSFLIPIKLFVDSSLDPLASRELSEKFIKLLPKGFGDYSVNDTVITGEKRSVHIPLLLPFNELVTYTSQGSGIVYEAAIKKINLTDLVCLMTIFEAGMIREQFLDTLTYVPFKYGSSEGSKYGVRLPKHLYVSVKGGVHTQLEVDFNSIKRMYYSKSHPWYVIKLETDLYDEPYLIFLDKLISQMGEINYYIMSYKRHDDTARYEKSFLGFKELISDLTASRQFQIAINNPKYLDVAVFYQLDEVIDILRSNNFVESSGSREYCEFVFHKDSLTSLVVGINHTIGGKVLSSCFEKVYFLKNRERIPYIQGYNEYSSSYYRNEQIYFENFEIIVLQDDGFENVSFLTTVWEPKGDSLKNVSVLDQLLYSGIGTVYYDTAFRIDNDRVFMIARTYGGDAGDEWGSIMFAVWTRPRKLEIYYKVDHFDMCCPREKVEADYRFINEHEILFSEMKYVFEAYQDDMPKLTDSTFVQTRINIDSLIRQKPIKYPEHL